MLVLLARKEDLLKYRLAQTFSSHIVSAWMNMKERKVAKIRNQYNQVPHLTKDTTWEDSDSDLKKSVSMIS